MTHIQGSNQSKLIENNRKSDKNSNNQQFNENLILYSFVRLCLEISENRTEWKSESSKNNFISGVWLGNGAMNLVFSHLPKRVLKILELIGFSGDRAVGMQLLDKCAHDSSGLRFYLGQLVICGYECYINQIFGARKSNLQVVEQFCDKGLDFCDQVFNDFKQKYCKMTLLRDISSVI